MRDVMAALRQLALADADISALVGTRVYVNRIPKEEIKTADTFHPPKMLVLKMAGGNGKADLLATDTSTIDTLCYGESDFEADKVRRAVWERFVGLTRETFSSVCIHHINPTGGAVSLVDPEIVWPAISQSYTLMADVKEA